MSHDPPVILLVDDSATQLAHMRMVMEAAGYETLTAPSAEAALNIVREQSLDIVVTDLEMPGMNGLELVTILKYEFPSLPVILTTLRGSEELAVRALREGAASYVPKRNLVQDLAETVERTLSVADAERRRIEFSQYVNRIVVELEIENDDTLLPQVLARLESPLLELGVVNEATSMHLGVALDEAIRNAMIHGNLEVSSELRDQEDGSAYVDLIQERLKDERFSSRRVRIVLKADHETATFVIGDDGPGFDLALLPDPTDPGQWEAVSGRGMLLIRSFMDEVFHNETGNEITMVLHKKHPGDDDDDDFDDFDDD